MRKLLVLIVCTLFINGISYAQQQQLPGKLDTFIYSITRTISGKMPDNTQFAYCVIRHNEAQYYGYKKISEQEFITVDNKDSVFEIGALTKIFTSTLLSKAVADQLLTLKDPVNKYIPAIHQGGSGILVGQLANHTSGLPPLPDDVAVTDTVNPYKAYGEDKLQLYLSKRLKLIHQPGEKYEYSTLGMALLGKVITQVYHKDLESCLQESIFRPFSMSHSSSDINTIKPYLVKGQDKNGNTAENWAFNALEGAGSVFTSASDLERFVKAHLEQKNEILNNTRTPGFKINGQMEMGLGWHIISFPQNSNKWYFHNGGTNGYGATLIMDIESKSAVILLTNLSAFHRFFPMLDRTAMNIMNVMQKELN